MPTKYEYYTTGGELDTTIKGAEWYSQVFTVGAVGSNESHLAYSVKLKLKRESLPSALFVGIRTASGGEVLGTQDLCTGSLHWIDVATTYATHEIVFSTHPALSASEEYAVVVRSPSSSGASYYSWQFNSAGTYTGGDFNYSDDSGSSWLIATGYDLIFEEWGSSSSSSSSSRSSSSSSSRSSSSSSSSSSSRSSSSSSNSSSSSSRSSSSSSSSSRSSSSSSSSSSSRSSSSSSSSSSFSSTSQYPANHCWGHDTSIDEEFAWNFGDGVYTGIVLDSGDDERLHLAKGEDWISGGMKIDPSYQNEVMYDKYQEGLGGSALDIYYKSGPTLASCDSDTWHAYTGHYTPTGGHIWIRVRLLYSLSSSSSSKSSSSSSSSVA